MLVGLSLLQINWYHRNHFLSTCIIVLKKKERKTPFWSLLETKILFVGMISFPHVVCKKDDTYIP